MQRYFRDGDDCNMGKEQFVRIASAVLAQVCSPQFNSAHCMADNLLCRWTRLTS